MFKKKYGPMDDRFQTTDFHHFAFYVQYTIHSINDYCIAFKKERSISFEIEILVRYTIED